VRISRIRLSDWLQHKHTAVGSMSVFHATASPWRCDRVCSDGSVLDRLSPSHQPSPSSTDAPEVRALPSTGITLLQRYYDPVRLPYRPAPRSAVEAATLVACGSPPLARSPVSTCCTHYPGGPVRVRLSAASPNRAAFPAFWPGRRPQLPFRGLLRLYTRYGPSIRSTAQGGLCRRASIRPVTQPHRLPATGPTDHYPGGTFTHEVNAPFGDAPEHADNIMLNELSGHVIGCAFTASTRLGQVPASHAWRPSAWPITYESRRFICVFCVNRLPASALKFFLRRQPATADAFTAGFNEISIR
jgi:hypothetical protein